MWIWTRACQKLGGEVNALQALNDKDLIAVNDPSNPSKIKYVLMESTFSKGMELRGEGG